MLFEYALQSGDMLMTASNALSAMLEWEHVPVPWLTLFDMIYSMSQMVSPACVMSGYKTTEMFLQSNRPVCTCLSASNKH